MRRIFVFALVTGCFAESEPLADSDSSEGSSEGASVSSTTGDASSSTSEGSSEGESGGAQTSESEGSASTTGESTGGSDSSDGGESSSTGEPHLPYQPCTMDDTSLCAPDEICIYGDDVLRGGQVGWCSASCNVPEECPEGTDGDASPICTYYGPNLQCSLNCANGEDCPTGMYCAAMVHFPEVNGDYVSVCVNAD
jgi:hypothetical protein